MEDLFLVSIAVILSALFSFGAHRLGMLTADGAAASFLVGSFVGVFGSMSAFILMTIFTVSGFAATAKGLKDKEARGLQEGKHGERTWRNIAGVGIAPCAVVLLNILVDLDPSMFEVMFISTMTVAGADTIASEIGVRDPKVYLITTFERVEPGTNGGISLFGTAVSSMASLGIAVLGWVIMTQGLDPLLLIPFVAGVFGNLMDSVFGVLLEDRGYISKYSNNCSTAILGALFGALILMVL